MSFNYLKQTQEILATLPEEKQAQVLDFASFLKEKIKSHVSVRNKKKSGSILSLIGIGKSPMNDVALRHDFYLYGT